MAVKIRKDIVDRLLIKANKPQSWLADQAETSASHMNNMLANRVTMTALKREKVMNALDVMDWDELFYIDNDIDESSQPMPV